MSISHLTTPLFDFEHHSFPSKLHSSDHSRSRLTMGSLYFTLLCSLLLLLNTITISGAAQVNDITNDLMRTDPSTELDIWCFDCGSTVTRLDAGIAAQDICDYWYG